VPPGDKGYEDIHKGKKDICNKEHRGTNRGYSCFVLRMVTGEKYLALAKHQPQGRLRLRPRPGIICCVSLRGWLIRAQRLPVLRFDTPSPSEASQVFFGGFSPSFSSRNVYNAKKPPWLVLPGTVLTEAGKTTEVGPSDVTGPAAAASVPNHWNYCNRREDGAFWALKVESTLYGDSGRSWRARIS
jgi:hypothetical protein